MFKGLIERVRFGIDHRWSPAQMSAYLDGDLTQAGRGRIERHVHDCAHCRHLLNGLRSTIAALRGLGSGRGDRDPGASVAPAVLAGFRRGRAEPGGNDGELG